ncbi:hypothetical protein Cgig2_012918 [Carnegiea gigantea]|uniref:Uncharacterized protein n=1 Tax=Carnegiea gigantea TaxID=171969 RepID=A0A9Q1JT28_9CARY|nr:hypothetical protein Cgig2_012918 [Carnegiea gigantea]
MSESIHEQSGHTTTECRELKKALHELADKGQIDRFLKRGSRFLRREQGPAQPQSQDEECWTEQVLTTEQAPRVTIPTMVFGGKKVPRFAPHNDPLVIEMKIASAIVRLILIDTGSSIDNITWDCLKKLMHPGRDIVPLVHPILRFDGQKVNPTGMISLPVYIDDKLKSKNLEVDFFVIDVPTTYNVILSCPTLHKRIGALGNSGPSATITNTNPTGARPFLLSNDLPRADGPSGDKELVDAPFQDELLNELLEEKLEEASPEVEPVLVEATSAPGLNEYGAE